MGIEIEHKFLVQHIPSDITRKCALRQGYILNQPDRVIRVRTVTADFSDASGKGFLTLKGKNKGALRPEYEYEIPFAEAREMLDLFCPPPLIEKTRIWTEFEGFEWVIDQFFGENQGLVVAEIELESEDQDFPIPPWTGHDVTGDPRYYNSSLIKAPYATW